MKIHLSLLLFFTIGFAVSQQEIQTTQTDSVDTSYREDQFYFGVTYNALSNMPKSMSQNGFSSGFHLGFIRDIPINERRNWAIGIGIGYSGNSINQNLQISEGPNDTYTYQLLSDSEFTKNKFTQHLIELPLELRWRTSTATDYKFWRIYTGFKLGYVLASNTKFKGASGRIKHNNISAFNKFQYGLTLAVGYDSWNAYVHYLLNPVFENTAQLNGSTLDFRMFKIGIMLYIL